MASKAGWNLEGLADSKVGTEQPGEPVTPRVSGSLLFGSFAKPAQLLGAGKTAINVVQGCCDFEIDGHGRKVIEGLQAGTALPPSIGVFLLQITSPSFKQLCFIRVHVAGHTSCSGRGADRRAFTKLSSQSYAFARIESRGSS